LKSYEQLKEDKEALIKVVHILLDHSICATMTTKYRPSSTPDYANIARILISIKKE